MRRAVTIYLDEAAYRRLKMLVRPRPVSREIDMLIRRRIAELEGGVECERTTTSRIFRIGNKSKEARKKNEVNQHG